MGLKYDFNKGKEVGLFTKYSQLQVDTINSVVLYANKLGVKSTKQLAYILATAYHEAYDYDGKTTGTIQRLVPLKEKGSDTYLKSKKYYPYIGYGLVQLTWKYNFEKFAPIVSNEFGVDILANPELLLRKDISAFVIVYGMVHGSFTGKKLNDYINSNITDYPNARRIINGTDKMALIASYAYKLNECLSYE